MRKGTLRTHAALLLLVEDAHLGFVKLLSDLRRELAAEHGGVKPLRCFRNHHRATHCVLCDAHGGPIGHVVLQALHREEVHAALAQLLKELLAYHHTTWIHKVHDSALAVFFLPLRRHVEEVVRQSPPLQLKPQGLRVVIWDLSDDHRGQRQRLRILRLLAPSAPPRPPGAHGVAVRRGGHRLVGHGDEVWRIRGEGREAQHLLLEVVLLLPWWPCGSAGHHVCEVPHEGLRFFGIFLDL
mmetsp:Transcript_59336/g.141465  ORF Transcript_59336/g.141465 Transcript_59336/m.141465 type:complete len:240 (+) Transcript_59336:828-1547(+)